jgi:drug/metabolite transporter (DMT)-like permease
MTKNINNKIISSNNNNNTTNKNTGRKKSNNLKESFLNGTSFTIIDDSYFPIDSFNNKNNKNNLNINNNNNNKSDLNYFTNSDNNFNIEKNIEEKNDNKTHIVKDNFKAALIMIMANVLFSITNLIGKTLGFYYPEVNILTANFIRGLVLVIFSHFYFLYANIDIKKEIFNGRSKFKIFMLFLRSLCGCSGQIFLFLAFSQMRISSAYTIFNMMPICVSVFYWLFANGKLSKFDISALLICLFSVSLITKPSFIFGNNLLQSGEDTFLGLTYSLLALLSNSFGVYLLDFIKNDFEFFVSPYIMGYLYMIECGIAISFSDSGFESLGIYSIFLSITLSVFFVGAIYCFILGLYIGEPVKVLPITYLGVVLSLIFNIFIFKQGFDVFDLIGSIAIIIVNVYITITIKNH